MLHRESQEGLTSGGRLKVSHPRRCRIGIGIQRTRIVVAPMHDVIKLECSKNVALLGVLTSVLASTDAEKLLRDAESGVMVRDDSLSSSDDPSSEAVGDSLGESGRGVGAGEESLEEGEGRATLILYQTSYQA